MPGCMSTVGVMTQSPGVLILHICDSQRSCHDLQQLHELAGKTSNAAQWVGSSDVEGLGIEQGHKEEGQ